MGENTKVEWADYTWNGHCGCDPVHTGCLNCYAQVYFRRFGIIGKRRKTSAANWRKPLTWNKRSGKCPRCYGHGKTWDGITDHDCDVCDCSGEAARSTVFLSLSDPFEAWQGPIVDAKGEKLYTKVRHDKSGPIDETPMGQLRLDMFHLIDQTLNLDWLLLTKRPENITRMWPPVRMEFYRKNVHLLYSASDQETLVAGISHLLKCRDLVPVLGLSLEPLVGPVDLNAVWPGGMPSPGQGSYVSGIDRVIVGGESGPNARPCKIGWIRDIRDQCAAAGIPLFIKQLGANSTGWDYDDFGVALSDGNDGFAVAEFHDPKGGDWSEWPEDLKVRQYPEVKP